MGDPKPLTPKDTCPNCGHAFEAAPVPTAEQRTRAADRENREPLPPHFDTMSAEQRAEHGALWLCTRCDYKTRFPLAPQRTTTKGAAETA